MSARQSVYPTADSTAVLQNLSSCIDSVDLASRTLESINEHLEQNTNDFARFAQVLVSKKHFDLVSEKEINEAKEHLSAEIAPHLKQLILRAEEALEKEERKSKTLKAKAAQQSLRLEQVAQLHGISPEKLSKKEGDNAKASKSDPRVDRLRKELETLQAERVRKQREMNDLEEEVTRLKR